MAPIVRFVHAGLGPCRLARGCPLPSAASSNVNSGRAFVNNQMFIEFSLTPTRNALRATF